MNGINKEQALPRFDAWIYSRALAWLKRVCNGPKRSGTVVPGKIFATGTPFRFAVNSLPRMRFQEQNKNRRVVKHFEVRQLDGQLIDHLVAILLLRVPLKKLWKSVNSCWGCNNNSVASFLDQYDYAVENTIKLCYRKDDPAMRPIHGCPEHFWVPLLSQERVKLRTSNLACTFTGPIGIKAH